MLPPAPRSTLFPYTTLFRSVVVGLQILRIDGQNTLQYFDRVPVPAFEKENATQIVQRHAIARILRYDLAQVLGGFVVLAISSQDLRVKEVGTRQIGIDLKSSFKHGARALHVAFLHRGAADIHPTIRILGIDFSNLLESRLRALQVALE